MADIVEEIQALLQKATSASDALQARLDAGDDVSEAEMTEIAKEVAEALEEANERLRDFLGPMDTALLREEMVQDLTPEEFEEWSADNAALQEYRAEKKARRARDG